VPRFSNQDVFLGYIGVCIDIHDQRLANEELEKKVAVRTSELKRANQALEDKNRELERSNQELASFSYVASHDLQEPLRKIQAFTQRITEAGEFNDITRDYFNRIRAGARRMQNLIDSLLDFSRVNTSKNIFEAVDLNVLVQDVLLHLKDMIEEKAATVTVSAMPRANVIPVQFHQLLLNLIGNALKYGKANVPPVIRIEAERVKGAVLTLADIDANKDYWAIRVIDNGIGFEQQYEHKIFEIFQRLHGRHEYAGTGIGLAICKKIAQNHYGTIVATGVPDEGSVFAVYIPADH
jgi:light-regulated signal transduction histidine kinase (bacteriophytochrome)